MEQAFKTVVEYFGEDVKSATPEIFFGTFAGFVRSLEVRASLCLDGCPVDDERLKSGDLQRARKDNDREAEAARKAAERVAKEAEKAKAKDKDKVHCATHEFPVRDC